MKNHLPLKEYKQITDKKEYITAVLLYCINSGNLLVSIKFLIAELFNCIKCFQFFANRVQLFVDLGNSFHVYIQFDT